MTDPEDERVAELLDRASRGSLSEAEGEELALYAAERPGLTDELAARGEQARLGEGWMARVEADHQIAAVERAPTVQIERGVGLALFLGGLVASFVAPVAGSVALFLGSLLLLYSVVRVRVATHRRDPYKDVQR